MSFFFDSHRSTWLAAAVSNRRARHHRRGTCLQSVEGLEQRRLLVFNIQLNYSLDTSGFFADSVRRATLEQAAVDLKARIADDLAAIRPEDVNTWSISFDHPATGQRHTIQNPVIPANTIIVYVGARPFLDRIADGGAGGFDARGTAEWLDLIEGRGEPGVIRNSNADTDTALWGGRLAFDSTTTWNFSMDPPGPGENDFYSVAVHELAHTLGVSPAADSYRRLLNSAGQFIGTTAQASFGGPIPMFPDSAHFARGTMSRIAGSNNSQEALMDPDVSVGTRKFMTELDWAVLDDIGWDITPLPAPRNPTPRPDTFTIRVDGRPFTGNVLVDNGNGADTDPDGDALTVSTTVQEGPGKGTVVLNANGNFTYTPNTDATGTDSFVYAVTDTLGGQATATVTLILGTGTTFDFDIDNNQLLNPFQDATLIFAWMSAGTPNDTFDRFIDSSGQRSTAVDVKAYLDAHADVLDMDGNGQLNPFQDAVLVFALLSSGTPDVTLQRLIGTGAASDRDTPGEIRNYFATLQGQTASDSPATTATVFAAAAQLPVSAAVKSDSPDPFHWLHTDADVPQLPLMETDSDQLFMSDSPQTIWQDLLKL